MGRELMIFYRIRDLYRRHQTQHLTPPVKSGRLIVKPGNYQVSSKLVVIRRGKL